MINCKTKDATHEDCNSTFNNLICAYSDYYKTTIPKINKQELIAESSNKFIVSNKASHKCGIAIKTRWMQTLTSRWVPNIPYECQNILLLRVLQTAVPINSCTEKNIRCETACDYDVATYCNGSYCNNAKNIIINKAVFYPSKTLQKTANDSYKKYSNITCIMPNLTSKLPCVIVNYKNKNLNLQPSEFNTTQNFIDCDTKNTNPTGTHPTGTHPTDTNPTDTHPTDANSTGTNSTDANPEDNNNSANLNYLNPILVIISFFVSKIY